MFGHYFVLALRSFRRNLVLTLLMVAAIGVGIGASMTTVTLFRAMDGDPIPEKSRQLFAIQIENWDPRQHGVMTGDEENLQPQLSYPDATALMRAHAAPRQTALYSTFPAVTPADRALKPFVVASRAAFSDMFVMFGLRFRFGGPWTASDDDEHAAVAVIDRPLNDKLFGGRNSVGESIQLAGRTFRVVGVVERFEPTPRFYDLNSDKYGAGEQLYLPFNTAVEDEMPMAGNYNCSGDVAPGWQGRIHSECVWTQFWVELPTPADVAGYRRFLDNYAAEQQRSGRFHWRPRTRMRDVRDWLAYNHVVSDEVRILVLVSMSFLLVCLINAMGLMLAKFMGRSADIGVRRALGASRRTIFAQCLMEVGVVGLAGGVLGLVLTSLGLWGLRVMLSEVANRLARLDAGDVLIAVLLAVLSSALAGLYPTWRATRVQPAWQLKSQ